MLFINKATPIALHRRPTALITHFMEINNWAEELNPFDKTNLPALWPGSTGLFIISKNFTLLMFWAIFIPCFVPSMGGLFASCIFRRIFLFCRKKIFPSLHYAESK
jgi:hypothetical protein